MKQTLGGEIFGFLWIPLKLCTYFTRATEEVLRHSATWIGAAFRRVAGRFTVDDKEQGMLLKRLLIRWLQSEAVTVAIKV